MYRFYDFSMGVKRALCTLLRFSQSPASCPCHIAAVSQQHGQRPQQRAERLASQWPCFSIKSIFPLSINYIYHPSSFPHVSF